MLGWMTNGAGVALADDVATLRQHQWFILSQCLLQVISPYLVITLLLCLHT